MTGDLRPAPIGPRDARLLAGIVAGGLVIRVLHFAAISGTAFPRLPTVFTNSDMYAIWRWAQGIVAGDVLGRDPYHPYFSWMEAIAPLETWYRWWGGKEVFHQAPLYPYLVAGLMRVSGGSLDVVLLAQLVAGALQPLVVFFLARRLFDARIGLGAAALTAVYGPLVFHQGVLLRDWLPSIWEPLTLVALLRARAGERRRDWLVAGAALGVWFLTKETVFLFVPLFGLWLLVEHRGRVRPVAAAAGLLLLGFLLAWSPLLARNAWVGAPLPSNSNRAAESLIVANAADASPVYPIVFPRSMKEVLERSEGRLVPVLREIVATYHGDWALLLGHQVSKLRALVDPLEMPDNLNFYYGAGLSPALRFLPRYGVILPLGLAGFAVALGAWRRHWLLALYALGTVAGLIITIPLGRYRLTLATPLIVYGAAGLCWLAGAVRARRLRPALAAVGLGLGVAAAQHLWLPVPLPPPDIPPSALRPQEYLLAAEIYAADGRLQDAVAEMVRPQLEAIRTLGPVHLPWALSFYSLQEGHYRLRFTRALIAQGRLDQARRQVGLAQAAYGRDPRRSLPDDDLGVLYLELKDPATASTHFRRFLEVNPTGPRAEEIRRLVTTSTPPS